MLPFDDDVGWPFVNVDEDVDTDYLNSRNWVKNRDCI